MPIGFEKRNPKTCVSKASLSFGRDKGTETPHARASKAILWATSGSK